MWNKSVLVLAFTGRDHTLSFCVVRRPARHRRPRHNTNCIGAIDRRHVHTEAPPDTGSLLYNYKCFFSITLLAVCDVKYRFTKVGIEEFGSAGDANVVPGKI